MPGYKKIANTIIWSYITTPSQWKKMSPFKKKKKGTDWKELVTLPDYIFAFHVKDQPINAWYTVLEIKNPESFIKDISKLDFKKIKGTERYASSVHGIEFMQNGKQLLIANASVKNKNLMADVATDLLEKGNHIERQKLSENINAKAHLSWRFLGNGSVKNADGIVHIDKSQINATLNLAFDNQSIIQQKIFQVSDSALLSLAMMRPPVFVYKLIPQEVKQKLSRLINFNIDSLFQPGINYWQSEIAGFTKKVDTAISYDYDADFNPVEKKLSIPLRNQICR
ncbi:hypothetical protein [Niabella ginsengisoli]|uniref:Uncharacterized protein n=1 Tax=Niabella ginsengisoli TaxID=522298 RepID=A0ABS9SEZ9_9BACT|nr:hypothetical protein [Niabella ginsengisoli]MCH5596942.1 hypothetical protein [Niabella ginsengisoli]